MEIPFLPNEIINHIIYKCGGLQSPTAIIMSEFIKENDLYKSEVFEEPNFYEFLKLCKILKRVLPYIIIYDIENDTEYPFEYDSDSSGYSSHSNDLELD